MKLFKKKKKNYMERCRKCGDIIDGRMNYLKHYNNCQGFSNIVDMKGEING